MVGILKNKRAIITGAGSGMGKEIAKLFYDEGAYVSLWDLNLDSMKMNFEHMIKDRVLLCQTDVSIVDDVKGAAEQTFEKFRGVDILINCAGIPQAFTPIEELALDQWDKIININLKSIFLTSREVVPMMKQQKEGVIINIASIAGVRERPGLNAYCASKAGAISLSRALALELAEYNIRVNVINPGPAETPMLSKFINEGANVDEAKMNVFLNSVPMRKFVQPQDIAYAALYLSSDGAKIVTGEVLNVDGGRGV